MWLVQLRNGCFHFVHFNYFTFLGLRVADSCCTEQHGLDMASAQDTPVAAALCPSWLPQPSCFGFRKLMVSLILPTLSPAGNFLPGINS